MSEPKTGRIHFSVTPNVFAIHLLDNDGKKLFDKLSSIRGNNVEQIIKSETLNAVKEAKECGIKKLYVFIRGWSNKTLLEAAINSIKDELEIIYIKDKTPIPHNACIPKRVRRQ